MPHVHLHKPTTVGEAATIVSEHLRMHRNSSVASGALQTDHVQREDHWRGDDGQYRSGYESNGSSRKSSKHVTQHMGKHNNDWKPLVFF